MSETTAGTRAAQSPENDILFLSGGGEMGALMRAHDWSGSPLGSPETWPQSLRAIVALMLNSRYPMFVAWGPELAFLYNDGYAPIFGAKHPHMLGRPFHEAWSEIWDDIYPLIERALAGEATYNENLHLVMERNGYPEDTWYSFSYSPVRDESGGIRGMFCACTETTKNVLAASALRESETRFQQIADSAPVPMWVTQLDRKRSFVNKAYLDFLKVDYDAALEFDWRTILHLEDHDRIVAESVAGEASLKPFVLEARYRGGDGEWHWLKSESQPHWAADGAHIGFIGVAHDVTEAQQAEAILRESEQRFREQFENANDFIFTTDLEMRITSCNPAVANALERTPEELIGHRISDYTPPETWEHNKAMLAAKLAGKGDAARYEVEVFNHQGERMMWEINSRLIRNLAGMPSGLHAIGRDVTERKNADSLRVAQARMLELAASEAPLADLLNALLETVETESRSEMLGSILVVDGDGKHLRHGAAPSLPAAYSEAVDGIDIAEGVGSCGTAAYLKKPVYVSDIAADPLWIDFRELALEHDLKACWSTPILTSAGILQGTFAMYYRKPRKPTPADLQLVDFVTRSASLVIERKAAEAELHDLNKTLEDRVLLRTIELEQAQEALRQSQKLEAMGQLTGGVAHDFNNLLTPILGSLDLLQRRGIGDEREQRLIDGALQSAERAKLLVQRLLAFARRQPLKAIAVDVNELIGGMAELVGSTCGPNIRVSVAVENDIAPALADPNQLEMAILNLSVNARDAMPDGGRLTLSATSEIVAGGGNDRLSAGHYIRISVADTGTGMDDATRQRAIEPFFSTKGIGRGTGLGLSMVHGLASQLGGTLKISSNPGLGTNVELWLPASDSAVEAAVQTSADAVNQIKAGTILLVDDEMLVRMSTADMLSELGYEVVEASNAEDALGKFEDNRFDMLVTDHLMPGMSGVDLIHTVRQQQHDMPVLIVSGYAENDGIPHYLPRLTKPFRQADLAAAIADIVKSDEGLK